MQMSTATKYVKMRVTIFLFAPAAFQYKYFLHLDYLWDKHIFGTLLGSVNYIFLMLAKCSMSWQKAFHYLSHFLEGKKALNILHLAKQGCNDLPERYLSNFPA